MDDFVKSDGSRRGQYIEIHTSGPSVTLGKRMDFHGETEWIYNTPEKIREAKHINNLRIGFDIVDNPINPKLKRFKITKMKNSSATSPEEFIAEIDEKSTSDDQLLIAHKIFTNIGYSNTWALYGGKIVPENILVDKSAGLIAYRTHLFTPVITPNLHHVDSIGEDVFLLKKEGDFLKGIHIIGGLTYYGDRMDRIKLGSFSDGGNSLNYSVTKGKAYSKNKIETKHYQYNLTLGQIIPLQ
ncbi:MAG: hypothetical protein U9R34_07200 [Nanoarchaeota archaeon]|nr:hypothetical protein [Nanoarchaeota archaeon]